MVTNIPIAKKQPNLAGKLIKFSGISDTFQVGVDLGVMAKKWYSRFPKAPGQ